MMDDALTMTDVALCFAVIAPFLTGWIAFQVWRSLG